MPKQKAPYSSSYYKSIAVGKKNPTAKISELAKAHNLKPTDFVNRKAYLNTIARYAGYKNYYEWQKARRAIGIPKHSGGRKPKTNHKEFTINKNISIANLDLLNSVYKAIDKFVGNASFYNATLVVRENGKGYNINLGLNEGPAETSLNDKIIKLFLGGSGGLSNSKYFEKIIIDKSTITIKDVANAEDVF